MKLPVQSLGIRRGMIAGAACAGGVHPAARKVCAIARRAFRSSMNEAHFWILAADQLAAAGNEAGANQASNEADYYLGLAESALSDMSDSC